MRLTFLIAVVGSFALAATAQPPVGGPPTGGGPVPPVVTTPPPAAVLPGPGPTEKRAYLAAYSAVSRGVELFNNGNQDGCLFTYEGALMGIIPFLDSRPDLVKVIEEKTVKARGLAKVGDKAFALREALDAVMAAGMPPKQTLWDKLGGENAVRAVVHDFATLAVADKDVNFFRDGKYKSDEESVKKLEKLVVEFISANTGGPLQYTGRDMKMSHAGMKVTDAEFNALAKHLTVVLVKYKVPAAVQAELMAVVGSTHDAIVEVKK